MGQVVRLSKHTVANEANSPTKKNSTVWATRRMFVPTHMRTGASGSGWEAVAVEPASRHPYSVSRIQRSKVPTQTPKRFAA